MVATAFDWYFGSVSGRVRRLGATAKGAAPLKDRLWNGGTARVQLQVTADEAVIAASENRSRELMAATFQFRLRSLFLSIAACAFLLAGYGWFGNVVFAPVLLLAVVLGGLIWVIDAAMLLQSYASRNASRKTGSAEEDSARLLAQRQRLEELRRIEHEAVRLHDASRGPLENVLVARAARLRGEIDALRMRQDERPHVADRQVGASQ